MYSLSFVRWVKPIGGDGMLQFHGRKTCPSCQEPIARVHRYGRIINKTAVDLMEMMFSQKSEKSYKKIKEGLETAENEAETLSSSHRREMLKNLAGLLASECLELVDSCHK